MGKPFASELFNLDATYSWSSTYDIGSLSDTIFEFSSRPLLVVGSGGSLTAAHFMSTLHEEYFKQVSKHMTPMDLLSSDLEQRTGIALISSSGNNPDILETLVRTIRCEPKQLLVLCASKNNPVIETARKYKWISTVSYDLPSGKDGFLATNSLFSFMLLLTRAYGSFASETTNLPKVLPIETDLSNLESSEQDSKLFSVLSKDTISVLYDKWGHSAALDLESKFTEAALANIQLADYRNFAHGRHHWLAKHSNTSGVIALITPDSKELAHKTLSIIPKEIPTYKIETQYLGPVGTISLLVNVLYLTKLKGLLINLDPGRPGVPPFGRKIYHLGLKSYKPQNIRHRNIGIDINLLFHRKYDGYLDNLNTTAISHIKKDLRNYLNEIHSTYFQAVVCDYDDTLCSKEERFEIPSGEIIKECTRLLRSGVQIGIATGRGKSVSVALKNSFPDDVWSNITVGYYNGSHISSLDGSIPDVSQNTDPDLLSIYSFIKNSPWLSEVLDLTLRPMQLTIDIKKPISINFASDLIMEVTKILNKNNVTISRSSHSIDVVAPNISKNLVIKKINSELKKLGNRNPNILCIGDKGSWLGNDFDLLSKNISLSVDESSCFANSCWNIAPIGLRGVQATLVYLRALVLEEKGVRLDEKLLKVAIE